MVNSLSSLIVVTLLLLVAQSSSNTEKKSEKEYSRIIGGYTVTLRGFPFMVSIQKFQNVWSHHCGGSIISPRVVLTACHCLVSSYKPKLVYRHPQFHRVVAGVADFSNISEGQIIKVERIEVHPQCGGEMIVNDAGIVVLQREFMWTNYVKPISFFSISKVQAGTRLDSMKEEGTLCYSPGWGTTSNQRYSGSWQLKVTPSNLMSSKECAGCFCEVQGQECDTDFDNVNQVCARSPKGIPCSGDSGGPLVCFNQLYGLVSWKWNCIIGWPHVYTDIMPILDVAYKYLPQ